MPDFLDRFRLQQKTALVTGAADGIGAAIARALADAGATVLCHGNRRPADPVAAAIRDAGGTAFAVASDLASSEGSERLWQAATAAAGPVDILVNNAGMIQREAAEHFPMTAWDQVFEINVKSAFRLCQLAAPSMFERGHGKIINIASLLSFQGGIRVPAYAASKGAIAQMTKALANEWASRNVQVNAIAPGYIRTSNTAALQQDELRNRQILERIPAGRWGEPDDIAGAALFLASPASSYINGEILVVDGGWMGR